MSAHFAIIPARAGSKSVKNKNLQRVGSKSLVARSVEAATGANFFQKIYLSTDIPSVIEEYTGYNLLQILQRPSVLAGDDSLMTDVVLDIIIREELPANSYIWLLQPSFPFRKKEDFSEIKGLLDTRNPGSVVSVREVGASHPDRCYRERGGRLIRGKHTNFKNKQDLPKIYLRNGGYYVFHTGSFIRSHSFDQEPCMGFFMDDRRSVNIDSEFDLILARALVEVI